jgi:hypothetical protein
MAWNHTARETLQGFKTIISVGSYVNFSEFVDILHVVFSRLFSLPEVFLFHHISEPQTFHTLFTHSPVQTPNKQQEKDRITDWFTRIF